MSEVSLQPKYARGQTVEYVDHHGRVQTGIVTSIEGHWTSYGSAYVVYDVTHPSYRGWHMYVSDNDIRRAVAAEKKS